MPFKSECEPCICELCDCGRHHCPHRKKLEPFGSCVLSEYRNRYVPHPLEHVPPFKPLASNNLSDQPLSNETTHRLDYIPHPLEKAKLFKPPEYQTPEGNMDSTTMYRKDFTAKTPSRTVPFKPKAGTRASEPFSGVTNYKNDYRPWDYVPVPSCKRADGWVKPDEDFAALPTYTTDYVKHKFTAPNIIKPQPALNLSGEPLSDQTLYRQNYINHPLPKKEPKKEAEYKANHAPFDALSTHRRDYVPKTGGRLPSFKPVRTCMASEEPLESVTTHRQDYVPWGIDRAQPIKHTPYQAPEGLMEKLTSYNKDFKPHPLFKTENFKPKPRLPAGAPFEGHTNYQEEYRPWPNQKTQPIKPRSGSWGNTAPFDGQSMYNTAYVPHKTGARPALAKPAPCVTGSDQPLDDRTLYRQDYTPKYVKPCPATYLDTPSSDYQFVEQDDAGHKFYHPRDAASRNKQCKHTATLSVK